MNRTMCLTYVVAALACGAALDAAEWPFWRGPNHNSRTEESVNPAKFTGTPKPIWTINVGEGYAGVSVAGGRAFTLGHREGEDTLFCLDVATGREVWKRSYPSARGGTGFPGPQSTPVVDGDRLYTVSREGHVYCFDARSGRIVWQQDLPKEFGARRPRWDFSAAVRIVGDLALINANQHGIALDKRTGRKIWASPSGIGNYSVPALYQAGRETRIAIFGQKHLHGVSLKDGRLLWSFPWDNEYNISATDAEVEGTRIFITSAYNTGSAVLDIASGKPEVVWQNKTLQSNFGSCIIHDGAIYGFHGEAGKRVEFKCLDLKDGRELWAERLPFGAFIVAAGQLVMVTERGDLILARLQKTGYEEIARAEASKTTGRYWTQPSLAGGRLFIRCSKGDVTAFDVSP